MALAIQLRAPASGAGLRIPLATSGVVVVLPNPVLFRLSTWTGEALELSTTTSKPIALDLAQTIELEIIP